MNRLKNIFKSIRAFFKGNKKKILWIDMDDTICDFMTPWRKHVSKQLVDLKDLNSTDPNIISLITKIENFFNNGVKLGLTDDEKKNFVYPQSEVGFLLNLEPIPGAKENIEKLRQLFDVKILTKPSFMNPHCYSEKRLWIEKHYGLEMCEELWFSPDKALVRGDYLVDDYLWEGFKGKQLRFGTIKYPNWDVVFYKLVNNKVN